METISTVDTSKLIRKQLKKNFPKTKFRVRSRGDAIYVSWNDAQTDDQVNDIIQQYKGGGFDGMIDLEYFCDSWLLPDGTAGTLRTQGTEGSRGYVPSYEGQLPPGAKPVRFGAQYIIPTRSISDKYFKEKADEVIKDFALDPELYATSYERGYQEISSRFSPEIGRCFSQYVSNEVYKTEYSEVA